MSCGKYPSVESASSNPERLHLLLSTFRPRALNPEHYDQKLKFWIRAIDEYASHDQRSTFIGKELQKAFQAPGGGFPSCLPEVFQHLRRDGKLMTEEEFLASVRSRPTWFSWSTTPLRWAFNKVWSYSPGCSMPTIDNNTRVVYIPQLRIQENKVETSTHLQNRLMSLEEWKKFVGSSLGLTSDIDLLVEHMKASGKLISDQLGHVEVIKLVDPANSKSKEITQAEKGQYDIARTTELLECDLHNIYEKQEEAEKLARIALREGKRSVAKIHLRTKKNLEKRADKLNSVLDNLSTITIQIENSASDARVIAAYEAGKKAMDKQLNDNNMSADRVTDVMLDIQEALEDHDEVSVAIGRSFVDDDAEELDKELAALLKDSKPVDNLSTITLPSPPQGDLSNEGSDQPEKRKNILKPPVLLL